MKEEILDKIKPDYPWIVRGIAKLLDDHIEAEKLEGVAGEIERLTAEVRRSFEFGYYIGRDDADHKRMPRAKEAYNEWQSTVSGSQEKTCAGCGNKWHHDNVWCPECAIKHATNSSQAHEAAVCDECKKVIYSATDPCSCVEAPLQDFSKIDAAAETYARDDSKQEQPDDL